MVAEAIVTAVKDSSRVRAAEKVWAGRREVQRQSNILNMSLRPIDTDTLMHVFKVKVASPLLSLSPPVE